jgi:hydrogenase maturation protease
LLAAGLQEIEVEKLDRPGASLIPLLAGTAWVILIDAMQGGGRVGDIVRFDQKDWPQYCHGLSSHGFGVLEALSLARELGGLPSRLDLYGIEIGPVGPGDHVRSEIQAAAQQLARRIAGELTVARRQA